MCSLNYDSAAPRKMYRDKIELIENITAHFVNTKKFRQQFVKFRCVK